MKSIARRDSRRWQRRRLCWASLIACSCTGTWSRPLDARTKEDQSVYDYLVRDLGYLDTAARFLDSLEKQGRLELEDQAKIASDRIDLLKLAGKTAEAQKALEEFQRKFPNHARASLGNLESISSTMPKVVDLFTRAAFISDAAKAAALRAEGSKMFEEQVSKPLDGLIQDLSKKLEEARKASRGAEEKGKPKPKGKREDSSEVATLLRSLEYAELVRVQFYLTYARQLAESAPERKAYLEKGSKLAEDFVNDRFDFPVMLYNAQLHRGLYAFELERFAEAEEHLGVLYDVEPPVRRPFSKEVIDEFKGLRLQAILFGARAHNTARNGQKAVKVIQEHYLKPRKDEFDLTKAEDDPVQRTTAVLVHLEYGIALAGSGQAQKGLEEIQQVINKPGMPPALVTDARKALGRVAVMGGVRLRALDYYQAAIGLKSDRRWDEAIDTFQDALSRLSSRNMKEMNEVAPLCLNEIGEINFLLGNFVEAALAYQEVCRNFPGTEPALLSKVSTNFLASSNRAVKATPGGAQHSGLLKLKEEATRDSEKSSGGFGSLEVIMSDARGLEKDGKLKEAARKYLEVPREQKGIKVPFYWRAQANAWTCTYREWEQTDEAGRKGLETELTAAIAALEKIVPSAIKEGDKTGAAVGALTLGQAYFYHGDYAKAVTALKYFLTDLGEEETYRCYGLLTLILAECRIEAVDDAEKHFRENLNKPAECKTLSTIAIAASALSDAFEAAGNPKKAALYALVSAKHPSSKAELEKPRAIAELVRRLIDGDRMKDAQPYIEKLRGMRTTDDCLERKIASLDARVYQAAKDWGKVVAKLEKYVEDYKPHVEDKCEEDAYVLRDLGLAYLSRELKAPVKDLKEADRCYGLAGSIMQRRAQRDKSLEKTFWQWALELMKIKMRLGAAGERNAYRAVTDFVASVQGQDGDWGGLKDQFIQIEKEASARYAKALEKNP